MEKRFILISLALFIAAFIAGRYSAPVKTKIETRTEIKTEVIKDEHKAINTDQSTVEVIKPNGTTVRRTETRTRERDNADTIERIIEKETKKAEVETRKAVIVSLTASKKITDIFAPPVLGASVMFPVIFGIYGGVQAQDNASVGLSLGWGF